MQSTSMEKAFIRERVRREPRFFSFPAQDERRFFPSSSSVSLSLSLAHERSRMTLTYHANRDTSNALLLLLQKIFACKGCGSPFTWAGALRTVARAGLLCRARRRLSRRARLARLGPRRPRQRVGAANTSKKPQTRILADLRSTECATLGSIRATHDMSHVVCLIFDTRLGLGVVT